MGKVAVGSPTNMGVLSWRMKKFWDEEMGPHWMKIDGKIACAFSSFSPPIFLSLTSVP